MIDQSQVFFVKGFSVSWHDVYQYWQDTRIRNPQLFRRLGDPYFDKTTCIFIANLIVGDIQKKLGNDFTFSVVSDTKNVEQVADPFANQRQVSISNHVDWGSIDDIFKKAVNDLEEEHKNKREERKKKQEDEDRRKWNEWHEKVRKENEKLNQEEAKERAKQYQQRPPPPPAPSTEIKWREILGFGLYEPINEELIKRNFRKQIMIRHPDRGGSIEKTNELMVARDEAYKFLGLPLP